MKKLFILSVAFMVLFNLPITASTSTTEAPVCSFTESSSDKTDIDMVFCVNGL